MSRFYGPQGHKIKNKLPLQPSSCDLIRFVMKSAQFLDLKLDSLEEVTDEFAGQQRICICGNKANGDRVVVEWNNVDWLEEVE